MGLNNIDNDEEQPFETNLEEQLQSMTLQSDVAEVPQAMTLDDEALVAMSPHTSRRFQSDDRQNNELQIRLHNPEPRIHKFKKNYDLFTDKKMKQFMKKRENIKIVTRESVEPILEFYEDIDQGRAPVTSLPDEIVAIFAASYRNNEDPLNFLRPEPPLIDIQSVVDIDPPLDANTISNLMSGGISNEEVRPGKSRLSYCATLQILLKQLLIYYCSTFSE